MFIVPEKLLITVEGKDTPYVKTWIAGADGYSGEKDDYYRNGLQGGIARDVEYNRKVRESIKKIGIKTEYVTKSRYSEEKK